MNQQTAAVPFLQRPEAKMAEDGAGDELGGGRSSGIIGVIETEGITRGDGLLQHLRDALKPLVASDGPVDDWRATGDEVPRRISSGSGGIEA